jgi:hypothetical protein
MTAILGVMVASLYESSAPKCPDDMCIAVDAFVVFRSKTCNKMT